MYEVLLQFLLCLEYGDLCCFVYDCSWMTWLYLLKNKDEVLSVLQAFHAMVQTQFLGKIQTLCLNNDGDYANQ